MKKKKREREKSADHLRVSVYDNDNDRASSSPGSDALLLFFPFYLIGISSFQLPEGGPSVPPPSLFFVSFSTIFFVYKAESNNKFTASLVASKKGERERKR